MPIEEEIVQKTIEAIRSDMNSFKNAVAEELMNVATSSKINSKNNSELSRQGKIDIADPDFKNAINSLLTADPGGENQGKAVRSLKATEIGINSKIDSLIEKGADPKALAELKKDFQEFKGNLTKELQSDQGVSKVIKDRLQDKLIANNTVFFVFGKEEEREKIIADQKKFQQILKQANFQLPTDLGLILNNFNEDNKKKSLDLIVQKNIVEAFGKFSKDAKGNHTKSLDETKLTKDNIAKFGAKLNKDIESFAKKEMSPTEIIKFQDNSIKQIKYSPNTLDKIINKAKDEISKIKNSMKVKNSTFNIVGRIKNNKNQQVR